MALGIVRSVVTDWARGLAEVREHGADFYWTGALQADGDIVRPDSVRVDEGPLTQVSSRERDASEWYRCLRPAGVIALMSE